MTVRQPFFLRKADVPVPEGWQAMRIVDSYQQLKVGQRYDSNSVEETGLVPVVDQSTSGFLGYHDDAPGVEASPDQPVFTFANHTCAMRLISEPFSVIQNVFPKIGIPGVSDTTFLYYATMGRQATEEYKGHHPGWRTSYFALPPLDTQRAIASRLRILDDLIENNRRRIEILEEMARVLYREWFVHFRFPGHEGIELVDSELGPIPEGWGAAGLGESVSFVGGSTTTKAAYVDEGFAAFSAAGPDGLLPEFDVDGHGVVLSAVGARCGRTFRASGKWSSIANTIKMLPDSAAFAAWLYFVTSDPSIWPKRGSAQPFVSINDARAVRVVTPSRDSVARFEDCARPMLDLQDNLGKQNQVLREARDLLLPRLVSGELDVSELGLDGVLA